MTGSSTGPGPRANRREQRKQQTRRAIREHALRLFLADGYEATTVQRIAEAAGVSHMTFFRHFRTKESVVADDDYDPLIARLVRERPAGEPPLSSIHRALAGALRDMPAAEQHTLRARTRLMVETPALRAQLWENQFSTQELLAAALAARERGEGAGDPGLRLRVLAGTALAALTTALTAWVAAPEHVALPDLVDDAFAALEDRTRPRPVGGVDPDADPT